MRHVRMWAIIAVSGLAGFGCSNKDQDYRTQRPPLDEVSPRDRGLQSKDVLEASDRMAMDLLSTPELNQSSRPLRVVVAPVKDETLDRRGRVNYDVFIQRLKSNLSQQSQGRVQLVANREKINLLRNRELEGGGDEFGQGGGGTGGTSPSQNPDFVLSGTARDMPNRSTNYYQIEFDLSGLNSRDSLWNRIYEVRTSR